jgi:hypothetical protein
VTIKGAITILELLLASSHFFFFHPPPPPDDDDEEVTNVTIESIAGP